MFVRRACCWRVHKTCAQERYARPGGAEAPLLTGLVPAGQGLKPLLLTGQPSAGRGRKRPQTPVLRGFRATARAR